MSGERRPRVLFITPAYLPWLGGLEVLASQLLAELQRRGSEVGLITCPHAAVDAGLDEVNGVPVLRTGAQEALARNDGAAVLRRAVEIGRFTRDLAPDVVHTHDGSTALWMYLRTERHKRPLVATVHNVMSAHLGDELAPVAAMVAEASWVTGVSQDVVDDTAALFPDVADRLSLVRNAVQAPPGEPQPIAAHAPLICVGRLVPQKGFDMAIAAFASVAPAFPWARLQIVGTGPDRDDLVAQAQALGVGDRVELVGRVEPHRVPELLAQARALVMPSRYEGLPLVSLEAAWSARAVVAMAGPGLAEAVVDGVTGLLVPPGDVPGLAAAMAEVLGSTARASALGRAARARVEQEWSIGATVDQYEAVYRRVVAGHRAEAS
ncbi:glycosyltransferase family 4 protein [Aquihabitans sp. McL0605]|uniref:glycosyltransferase family 4 protein n=1 Tax=Aquihabitans sp. McL0605 TaxID=3415671 RepID=UPI003CF9F68D